MKEEEGAGNQAREKEVEEGVLVPQDVVETLVKIGGLESNDGVILQTISPASSLIPKISFPSPL